ncbi:MAG: ATP-binding protein [Thermodesulfobacteriota bacterium]
MQRLKPKFWDHQDVAAGPFKAMFNFRSIWLQSVLLTAAVALVPLLFLAVLDYQVSRKAVESEILNRTMRLVSNTRRSIAFFLEERKFALQFIGLDKSVADLTNPERLQHILYNLRAGLGFWSDIGVIDLSGNQLAHAGPFGIANVNYADQPWFRETLEKGSHISDVFLGFRNAPHLVIAVKHAKENEPAFILRASLDIERFNDLLSRLEVSGQGDAFIVNQEGVLQTPSRYYGNVLDRLPFAVPPFSDKTQAVEMLDHQHKDVVLGYAYISDTPFVLMVIKQKTELLSAWQRTRSRLMTFLGGSVLLILLVVFGVSTYLVNNLYLADRKRVMTLHQVEYANKLASIGRLAAGVAHEINNPLAIINEKAGLMKDLFLFRPEYGKDEKLLGVIDAIIASVDRCAAITRRLLNFARHVEVNIQQVRLRNIIDDVLGFQTKEAEHRSIAILVDIPEDIPNFVSDRGKLQQIFLNLINNAFAAMKEGGRLIIRARRLQDEPAIVVTVQDNGCGIPQADIRHIFEPFFTTKSREGGTGLGLSITYGLVQEIGGRISVESQVGKGTTFTIVLPLEYRKESGEHHERSAGG